VRLERCHICWRRIWPWQAYGYVTLSDDSTTFWHRGCYTHRAKAIREKRKGRP
jgi:hypothetical protein